MAALNRRVGFKSSLTRFQRRCTSWVWRRSSSVRAKAAAVGETGLHRRNIADQHLGCRQQIEAVVRASDRSFSNRCHWNLPSLNNTSSRRRNSGVSPSAAAVPRKDTSTILKLGLRLSAMPSLCHQGTNNQGKLRRNSEGIFVHQIRECIRDAFKVKSCTL